VSSSVKTSNLSRDLGFSGSLDVGVWQWRLASLFIAAVVAAPILIIFSAWGGPVSDVWVHLANTVLSDLLRNTLVLIVGVGSGVFVLGVGLAWLTTMCEFPGRRQFEWALMLPLAIPAYVLAFVAIGVSAHQIRRRRDTGDDVGFLPLCLHVVARRIHGAGTQCD